MNQADLEELIKLLKDNNEHLRKQNEEQQKQIQELTQTVANLNETVLYLKNKLFGPSSEKAKSQEPVIEGQQNFFNEAEDAFNPSLEEPTLEEALAGTTKKKRKKKATRAELLENLPIIEVNCQVSEEDQICGYCNSQMEFLGRKFVREEIRIISAQVKRIHYMQETYICPQCRNSGEPEIVSAGVPVPLMKHSLASPSTVAHVMYQKYVNAMPLYRQSKDWEQMGVKIPRATLANWVIKCGLDYLKPIFEHLHKELLERDIIHADETTCQVLKENGRKATSKSYMWIYGSGNDELPPIRLYEYQPGRSGDYAVRFLDGFTGYLTCDGFSGYNKLKNVTRCGCLAHMRRYWYEAIPAARRNSKGTPTLPAEIGMNYCNQLFMLEDYYKDLTPDQRKEQRLQTEVPIWKAYWAWIETLNPTAGGRLAKAITYANNQRPHMENYLLDGRCSISNNIAENIVRPYTVGRKNFLFHATPKGAEASSIIYSIVETAKANNLNIQRYLETLLIYMPGNTTSPEGIEGLMPWSIKIQATCRKK